MPALIGIAAKAAMMGSVALAPATSHANEIVVKPGDTLSALATANNVPGGWESLYAANRKLIGQNPDLIYPGKKFTIPHHVLAATAAIHPDTYAVRSGDTLTKIAQKFSTPGGWESIFADNHSLSNPNALNVGMTLSLPHHAMFRHWSAPVYHAPVVQPTVSTAPRHSTSTARASGSYHGSGSMEECIIAAESGGNSSVMNSSGHYGLYQFSESTWIASGGSAATFGNASVAEQQQVFRNAVAARGYSDWTPYDGC